jgi:hypothetical protein
VASNGLLGVRCGADLDPVLLVGAASRRPTVFVGGRFGVPLRSPPRDARLIGRSPVGGVLATSNEPRSVYVEAEGAVRRWLQLPAPTQVSAPPRVFLMGDSILFGSETFVDDELDGWSATFDAAIGRASLAGVAVAAAHADPPPDIAVVELGTNDADPAAFAENAGAILDSFAAADFVVWVNVHSPAVAAAAINREIRAAVASRTNAVIADWSARAPEEEFSGDGIHLSPGHEGAFAAFLAPFLRAWRAAVDGAGLARCVASVEAAVRA